MTYVSLQITRVVVDYIGIAYSINWNL